ncbi:MAG: hypothetical protein RLZZ383_715, partial [Pseudomonadota bacterium]
GPLIGGTWRTGGASRTLRHPWNGAVLPPVADAPASEVDEALSRAHAARQELRTARPEVRAGWLRTAATAVANARDAFAKDLLAEGGKPITLALAEVDRAIDTLHAAAAAADDLAHDDPRTALGPPGAIQRRPAGIAVAITPFNFPLNLVVHKVGPALAAGCPVLIKPAPETPTAALRLGALLVAAGVPPDAVAVLPGDREVAQRLATAGEARVVSFTGSALGGRAIAASAAGKRVVLELGGVAHAVILDGTDLHSAAARLALGAFAHAGQSCISTQHIHVPTANRDAFLEALIRAIPRVTPFGDPADPTTRCGSVLRLADADRIRATVREAVTAGARRVLGDDGDGVRIPPHVLVDPPWDVRLGDEEVFGPVVAVHGYARPHDAIARIQGSVWGLQAALFGPDAAALEAIADDLDVGGIVFQDATARRIDAWPYGGARGSGVGREGPAFAVEDYLTWQTRLHADNR